MNKTTILISALLMALAVALGAFGAHGLKDQLSTSNLEIYKTANFYHFIHGMALFIVLLLSKVFKKELKWSFYFFSFGILIFSGSLYILSLRDIFPSIPGWFGAITPIGGLLSILAWLSIAFPFLKKNKA